MILVSLSFNIDVTYGAFREPIKLAAMFCGCARIIELQQSLF